MQLRDLLQELQAEGPLPRCNPGIVEGLDEGASLRFRYGQGPGLGFVIGVPGEEDPGAGALHSLLLHRIHPGGNADRGGDPLEASHEGHGPAVIPAGAGDHAAFQLIAAQSQNPVRRPPDLEGPRHLQVLELEEYPGPPGFLQLPDPEDRSPSNVGGDGALGLGYVQTEGKVGDGHGASGSASGEKGHPEKEQAAFRPVHSSSGEEGMSQNDRPNPPPIPPLRFV